MCSQNQHSKDPGTRARCSQRSGELAHEQAKITAGELVEMLASEDRRPVVVDVREPFELEVPTVPGAVNVPLGELHLRVGELAEMIGRWENDVHVVTVCASGRRSAVAAKLLSDQGMRVRDLDGGIAAWHGFHRIAGPRRWRGVEH